MWVLAVLSVVVLATARLCGGHNYGTAAFLTENIKSGKVDEARRQAKVSTTLKAGLVSYAGYITVNQNLNTTLYFWYFPSENGGQQDPLVLWLPSTLGQSAMVTLFEENGPMYIGLYKGLKTRSYYLSKVAGVIYVDSPVGAGFSFAGNPKGYSQDFASVSGNLYEFLNQFLTMFPDLVKSPFYIAGQGQACPSVVGLANLIDRNNMSQLKINLSGLVIGNGFCDPINVVPKFKTLVGLGLLSPSDNQVITAEQLVLRPLKQQQWNEAFDAYDTYAMGIVTPYPTLLSNKTNFPALRNLVEARPNFNFGNLEYFFQEKDVLRRSIHAGPLEFKKINKLALSNLRGELMQGVMNQLGSVMSKYNVLLYNSQLNGHTTVQAQTDSQAKLSWCGTRYYDPDRRLPWLANNTLFGYLLAVSISSCKGSMLQATILNSGDNPFSENPASAVDLILGFFTKKHYNRHPHK